ncbi:MAG: prolyl-tRNA synthetase associated domain-containing protein [Chloroflexi bacterium]|nr:prolyl-tRNA synthetase associated domain-containing protein [Chloroflexota bacterium]
MFVENRDGHKHYLVIVASNKRTDMAKLAQSLGARRLSFGSKKPLLEWLHATPGTVSPFGLIYDTQKNVSVVIDEELLQVERVGFHTHDDTSTLVVSLTDLLVYLNATAKSVSTLAL